MLRDMQVENCYIQKLVLGLKNLIKKLVTGTRFESIARRTYKQIYSHLFEDPINARYNRQTIAIMKRTLTQNSNCVDVGSSVGEILWEMLRFAPDGTHYAFEPVPTSYTRLVDSFPTVNVYNLALSDTIGEEPFYVVSDVGYSGLRRREYPTKTGVAEVIRVRTDYLDNIIPASLPVHFIKIDVEGAELQVLRGASDTIRRNRPIIVFEHQRGAADHYGTMPEAVYDLFTAQCGLRVSLLESWLKGERPLRRQEFAGQFFQRINFMFVAHP